MYNQEYTHPFPRASTVPAVFKSPSLKSSLRPKAVLAVGCKKLKAKLEAPSIQWWRVNVPGPKGRAGKEEREMETHSANTESQVVWDKQFWDRRLIDP